MADRPQKKKIDSRRRRSTAEEGRAEKLVQRLHVGIVLKLDEHSLDLYKLKQITAQTMGCFQINSTSFNPLTYTFGIS